jgi:Ca2+-transporting ATPase
MNEKEQELQGLSIEEVVDFRAKFGINKYN